MIEEERIQQQQSPRDYLRVIGDRSKSSYGLWVLAGTPSYIIRERFMLAAARAGRKLGPPPAVFASSFWFSRLYEHLSWIQSEDVAIEDLIQNVCRASATLCANLERREIDRPISERRDRPGLSDQKPSQTEPQASRSELRDRYLAQFPEKLKILDVCWAAGQHYSEWKRWLRGVLKDGSTPDLAFRAILTSNKRPRDYKRTQRPDGWK